MTGELLGHFTISVPARPLDSDYVGDRSALFIPKQSLVDVGFEQSETNPHVMVTRNPMLVLEKAGLEREFGSRDGVEGWSALESDPSKQQLIAYAFVTAGDHALVYRRAVKGDVDSRLVGALSMGFGGHTETSDATDLAILHENKPGQFVETEREDGSLRKGLDRELEEELGVSRKDVELKVVGAFHEQYTDDELSSASKMPIGAVHTCIIATAQLSPEVRQIRLQSKEIASAFWVKISSLQSVFSELKEQGVTVENWTDIGAIEFADILNAASSESRDLPEIVIA